MFPDKPADPIVLRNGLIPSSGQLVTRLRSSDWRIVNVRYRELGDLGLQDEGDVVVKDWYRV
ncbi:unnamed protein product [Mycena citricolor]|uniref:Uncharacterized protein n=1 Tax=Mycena citricolor TaxID=2018698 RepID=A0AAD2GY31_9AGAR|nr:unnamed protein product [Mycena citricolor]